uniref:Uncharacterized protein n=1 Tax=Rhodnius prolixus TaxID=13249 RepID=T1HEA2_RHOPR
MPPPFAVVSALAALLATSVQDDEEVQLWTAVLLPDVRSWVGRGFGEVDYYLTQLLSGHGYFREFLRKMGKRSEGNFPHCTGMRDDAHHTFLKCERWGVARRNFGRKSGPMGSRALPKHNAPWQGAVECCGDFHKGSSNPKKERFGRRGG